MEYLKEIWVIFLSVLSFLFGGLDSLLTIFAIMLVLDYVTGILKAIIDKKLNSKVGLKGIIKKIMYLVIIAVSVEVDKVVGNTGSIRTIVILFFISNEGLSIIENYVKMGGKAPKKLVEMLEQLSQEE